MNKFKSKKGFTLAELLIVVAIIAVLVAIAVPLFVTGLKKAEEGTIQANERSLKAMAAVEIMSNDKLLYVPGESDDTLTDVAYVKWYVKGTYDAKADKFTIENIYPVEKGAESKTPADWTTSSKSGDVFTLYTFVTATELAEITPSTPVKTS